MSVAVFDCVVYLQAAISDQGPAAACLSLVEGGRVALVASPAILAEVRDVLSRDKLRKKFPHLTDARVEQFVQHIGNIAQLLPDGPSVITLPRDPDDALYVDVAIAAQAKYLVSRDKDLLDLMTDSSFRQQYPDLAIVDPAQFLKSVPKGA
jgi:putative PIN family toxin of toxin-antitoxin system